MADRGFGWLLVDGTSQRVFVHISDVHGCASETDHPNVGDVVECEVIDAGRGPRAVEVQILKRSTERETTR